MPAYILVNVNINEPIEYEEYKKLTPASIAAYGGKFVIRGGATEILEGNPSIGRWFLFTFLLQSLQRHGGIHLNMLMQKA